MPDKPETTLRALVIGDIVGQAGCRALFSMAKSLKREFAADMVVVNGENAVDGSGLTPEVIKEFFEAGADVVTSGNHIWKNKAIYPVLDTENRLLRPENYPKGVPGKGHCTITVRDCNVSILNLEGGLNRSRLRCPFAVGREMVHKLRKESPVILVDFHAESAQEKEALATYLDGEISALFGTHTHVQTADERVLSRGTGYITDIGMTGPEESVIGMSIKVAIDRALTQMPLKLEIEDKPAILMGVVIEINPENGKTIKLERFQKKSSL
ncbi:MAG: TIGR00282 family metallophosphoesterase [Spirochaetales bacterium]|nr:TIGR00282 family metallophosphoesterase [Spirochaetales bacterium]